MFMQYSALGVLVCSQGLIIPGSHFACLHSGVWYLFINNHNKINVGWLVLVVHQMFLGIEAFEIGTTQQQFMGLLLIQIAGV
jgi:hypothetical protein